MSRQYYYTSMTSLLLGICLIVSPNKAAWSETTVSREDVVMRLQHQEALVRSTIVEYTSTYAPTPGERIPLIREACRHRGMSGQEYMRFVVTDEQARQLSYACRWWRKGPKERSERFDIDSSGRSKPKSIQATDGEVLRGVASSKEGTTGSIYTSDVAHWSSSDRVTPFTMLYEFMSTPYSEIVARGSDFTMDTVDHENVPLTRISVSHPTFESFAFVVLFDDDLRLIQRDVLAPGYSANANESVTYNRVEFSDYRSYRDVSGEIIEFPHQAIYRWYVGKVPSGKMAEWGTQVIEIENIKFNVAIPDQLFVLGFPKDANIWDGIRMNDWVAADQLPKPDRPSSRIWILLLLGNLCVLVVVVLLYNRYHRKRITTAR